MLPGITGLWQVSGRADLDFDDLVQLDFLYLEQWSVFLDLSILVKTVPAVLSGAARIDGPSANVNHACAGPRRGRLPPMPPTDRFVISFAAEPPQEALPDGEWAATLSRQFLAACEDIEPDDDIEELGAPGEVRWFPDRTFDGRTYVPATARTSEGFELFGFVSFVPSGGDAIGPSNFLAWADYTDELAEENPDWKIDLTTR